MMADNSLTIGAPQAIKGRDVLSPPMVLGFQSPIIKYGEKIIMPGIATVRVRDSMEMSLCFLDTYKPQ